MSLSSAQLVSVSTDFRSPVHFIHGGNYEKNVSTGNWFLYTRRIVALP